MALPASDNVAGLRVVDARCGTSPAAFDRTAAQLSKMRPWRKEDYLYTSVVQNLGALARCALRAGVCPDARGGEAEHHAPMIVGAAITGSDLSLAALLQGGANPSLPDATGATALHEAAKGGFVACVRLLLAAGASAHAVDFLGFTPLMMAVARRRTECVRVLVPVSDLRIFSRQGFQALHICAISGDVECLALLLPHTRDVDARTVVGIATPVSLSALHLACSRGHWHVAKALLKHGADRMARDSQGWLPLHWAAVVGDLSCATLLVGRPGSVKMTPAQVSLEAEDGVSALHCAALNGFERLAAVLIEAGARLDAGGSQPAGACTLLMFAQEAHPGNAALLALLSGQGPAQPPGTVCDHCGKTAAQASVRMLKACDSCHDARYCGEDCAAAAWPGHKAACRARKAERDARTLTRSVPLA